MPKLVILISLWFMVQEGYGQFEADSVWRIVALRNTIAFQMESLGGDLRIFNGAVFSNVYRAGSGHPFFLSDTLCKGEVLYDGGFFTNVPLMYDLLQDELVTQNYMEGVNINLVKNKVAYFVIQGCLFVYLPKDSAQLVSPDAGFYQVLVQGKVTALAKRMKLLDQKSTLDGMQSTFIPFNEYYLINGGKYFRINSDNDLAKALGLKRSVIAEWLGNYAIRYRKEPEKAIIKTLEIFNSTSK